MAKQKITGLSASMMMAPPAPPSAAVATLETNRKPVAQTVKVPDILFVRLKTFSAKHRRTNQDILLTALEEYLDKNEGK